MILESSADSSMAVSGTIRAKIHCFSMVSIHVEKTAEVSISWKQRKFSGSWTKNYYLNFKCRVFILFSLSSQLLLALIKFPCPGRVGPVCLFGCDHKFHLEEEHGRVQLWWRCLSKKISLLWKEISCQGREGAAHYKVTSIHEHSRFIVSHYPRYGLMPFILQIILTKQYNCYLQ